MLYTFSKALVGLLIAAASVTADYTGSSAGGITITYPTLGAIITQGQTVTITWTATGLYSPLVSIKLVSIVNNQPDTANSISISDVVQTSAQAYSWKVGQQSFSGGNTIEISSLFASSYSGSFTVQVAPTSANISTSLPPNATSTTLPLNMTSTSAIQKTTSLMSLSSSSGSSTLTTPTQTGNSTDINAPPSSGNSESTVWVVMGTIIGVVAFGGVLYFGLRKTRRRRRPVSMPLVVEDSEDPNWSPPDWTAHNTPGVPSYRRPPGYSQAGAYSTGQYADSTGYYADALPQANVGGHYADAYADASSQSNWSSPAATAIAVPQDAFIREKTAVSSSWKEEGAITASEGSEGGNKPNALD